MANDRGSFSLSLSICSEADRGGIEGEEIAVLLQCMDETTGRVVRGLALTSTERGAQFNAVELTIVRDNLPAKRSARIAMRGEEVEAESRGLPR